MASTVLPANAVISTWGVDTFENVQARDVVFHTVPGLSNRLVLGNSPALPQAGPGAPSLGTEAALYVSGNCVGVRRVPGAGAALDVSGALVARGRVVVTAEGDPAPASGCNALELTGGRLRLHDGAADTVVLDRGGVVRTVGVVLADSGVVVTAVRLSNQAVLDVEDFEGPASPAPSAGGGGTSVTVRLAHGGDGYGTGPGGPKAAQAAQAALAVGARLLAGGTRLFTVTSRDVQSNVLVLGLAGQRGTAPDDLGLVAGCNATFDVLGPLVPAVAPISGGARPTVALAVTGVATAVDPFGADELHAAFLDVADAPGRPAAVELATLLRQPGQPVRVGDAGPVLALTGVRAAPTGPGTQVRLTTLDGRPDAAARLTPLFDAVAAAAAEGGPAVTLNVSPMVPLWPLGPPGAGSGGAPIVADAAVDFTGVAGSEDGQLWITGAAPNLVEALGAAADDIVVGRVTYGLAVLTLHALGSPPSSGVALRVVSTLFLGAGQLLVRVDAASRAALGSLATSPMAGAATLAGFPLRVRRSAPLDALHLVVTIDDGQPVGADVVGGAALALAAVFSARRGAVALLSDPLLDETVAWTVERLDGSQAVLSHADGTPLPAAAARPLGARTVFVQALAAAEQAAFCPPPPPPRPPTAPNVASLCVPGTLSVGTAVSREALTVLGRGAFLNGVVLTDAASPAQPDVALGYSNYVLDLGRALTVVQPGGATPAGVRVTGDVTLTGDVTAHSYKYRSDQRLKVGVSPSDARADLEAVAAVRVRRYAFADTGAGTGPDTGADTGAGGASGRAHTGVLAHELEAVMPDAVSWTSAEEFVADVAASATIAPPASAAGGAQLVRLLSLPLHASARPPAAGALLRLRDGGGAVRECRLATVLHATDWWVEPEAARGPLTPGDGYVWGTRARVRTVDTSEVLFRGISALQALAADVAELRDQVARLQQQQQPQQPQQPRLL
jgi:hypothetical protein